MEITEVRVFLMNEEKLKAYVTVTFDDCFVIRDLKVIEGNGGIFVAMPSKKRKDGTFKDIAHPLNNDFREKLEKLVLDAYQKETQQGSISTPAAATPSLAAPPQPLSSPPPLTTPVVQAKTPDQIDPKDYSAPDE